MPRDRQVNRAHPCRWLIPWGNNSSPNSSRYPSPNHDSLSRILTVGWAPWPREGIRWGAPYLLDLKWAGGYLLLPAYLCGVQNPALFSTGPVLGHWRWRLVGGQRRDGAIYSRSLSAPLTLTPSSWLSWTPSELFSDQGGGGGEGREERRNCRKHFQLCLLSFRSWWQMSSLKSPCRISGREIWSVKRTLYITVGPQPVTEDVLLTVPLEVQGVLNAKPLGYVLASITDLDPVTPNSLLMGGQKALCHK